MTPNVGTGTPTKAAATAPSTSYRGPLVILTTLFFMWGSLTSLNDVLIPYVQHVFKIRLAASMLIQTAFFSAYFVFSIPASKIIDWIGYKKAIVVGLITMVVACLGFYPAARIPSFPFFLFALIVLATGITILQVAANPYVAVLGKPKTASSRLVLTQAFNSLGTAVFPWVGATIILGSSAAVAQTASQEADAIVKLYVYFFAVALFILAIGIAISNLPKIESAEHHIGEKVNDSVWKHPNLAFAAIGIFMYVGGEVAIGSSIANYLALPNIGGFAPDIADPATRYHAALGEAARYISVYWLGAMIGRFIGSAILRKVKAGILLALCAVMAALLVGISVLSSGNVVDPRGRLIQLDHVPLHFHTRDRGTRTAHRRRIRHLEYGNRGRRYHPVAGGQSRGCHQPRLLSGHDARRDELGTGYSLCASRGYNLLRVHFVLRRKRIEAK
jgi:FHS family L-fucose permease-like MFS transporter